MTKDNPTFSLFCSCGCSSGFEIRVLDGTGYLSFVSSDFYSKQKRNLFAEVKELVHDRFKYGQKKNLCILKEMIVTGNDIDHLDQFLSEYIHTEDIAQNESEIKISADPDFEYCLRLVTKREGVVNVLYRIMHEHRQYDIVIDNAVRDALRRQIRRAKRRKANAEHENG